MAKLSARGACTEGEDKFCRKVHASGGRRVMWAFQETFCFRKQNGHLVLPSIEPTGYDPKAYAQMVEALPDVLLETLIERSEALLQEPHIQDRLAELKSPAAHIARGVLVDQMVSSDPKDGRASAIEVLKQEEKAGHADAVDMWVEHLIEAGAVVDVPLPYEIRKEIACEQCGHVQVVVCPLDVTLPFADLFPNRSPESEA